MKVYINTKNILRLITIESEKFFELRFSTLFGEFVTVYSKEMHQEHYPWDKVIDKVENQKGFIQVDGMVEEKIKTIK